jgi:hypothetical protein
VQKVYSNHLATQSFSKKRLVLLGGRVDKTSLLFSFIILLMLCIGSLDSIFFKEPFIGHLPTLLFAVKEGADNYTLIKKWRQYESRKFI